MPWSRACRAEDIRTGEARAVEVGEKTIAVYNVEGQFFATDDSCTHEEASLADGFVENHLVECPLHGSQFDLRTGEVLSLPAVFPVGVYSTRVENGEVHVDIPVATSA